MALTVHIELADGGMLPAGSTARVEIRDASVADAPSTTVERIETTVPEGASTLSVDLPASPQGAIVWVHLDGDGSGRVARGDYITMESFPLRPDVAEMTVRVRRVD